MALGTVTLQDGVQLVLAEKPLWLQAWTTIAVDHKAAVEKLELVAMEIRFKTQSPMQATIMQRMATACQKAPQTAYKVAAFARWAEFLQASLLSYLTQTPLTTFLWKTLSVYSHSVWPSCSK